MPYPKNVIVLLTTTGGAKYTGLVEVPTLDAITDALVDLSVEVSCDEEIEAVKVGYERFGSRHMAVAADAKALPEQIAASLWGQMTEPASASKSADD